MSDIINIGGIAVCKFYLGDSSDVKIYLGTTKLYPHLQEPCFAVVDNISTYTARTYVDVYETSSDKWYKLNNLNVYEEYGVYGSGRTECTQSRLPQGYTEVEYVENTSTSCIDSGFKPNQDTRIIFTAQTVTSQSSGKLIGAGSFNQTNAIQLVYEPSSTGSLNISWGTVAGWTTYSSCVGDYNVHTYDWNKNEFYRDDTLVGSVTYANFQCTYNMGIFRHIDAYSYANAAYFKGKMFALKIYDNGTLVRDMIPCQRDSDSKYGMYDIVNDTFYSSITNAQLTGGNSIGDCVTTYEGKLTIDDGYEYQYSGSSWVNVGSITGSVYPIYYDEIQDPPNNLSFSSMTEAESYECPWVGMKATIDGDKYIFSGDSQSGYEWVYQSLPYDAEIQYLESNGTQYIDTGAYLNISNFEVGYAIAGKKQLFGYSHQNKARGTWLGAEQSAYMFWGTNTNSTDISSYLVSSGNTIVFTHSGATVNGYTISKTFSLGSDSIANISLLVFARYDFYSHSIEFRGSDSYSKFKSFYLKNNGELVVDMIPVRVGQVGYMYDRVSGQLFGNAGTGSFILGPDVN